MIFTSAMPIGISGTTSKEHAYVHKALSVPLTILMKLEKLWAEHGDIICMIAISYKVVYKGFESSVCWG